MFSGTIKRDGNYAVIRIPMEEIHGLRVALEPCPCKATKSTATDDIKRRISRGLAILQTRGM